MGVYQGKSVTNCQQVPPCFTLYCHYKEERTIKTTADPPIDLTNLFIFP